MIVKRIEHIMKMHYIREYIIVIVNVILLFEICYRSKGHKRKSSYVVDDDPPYVPISSTDPLTASIESSLLHVHAHIKG